MQTDRIAELRALIAAEEAAHRVMRMSSNVPLVERIRARNDAADAVYAAMERDVPALLDCAEALRDVLEILPICPKNTGLVGIEAKYEAAVVAARVALAAVEES